MRGWIVRQPVAARLLVVIVVVAGLRIAVLLRWIPPDWAVSEDAVQDWIDRAAGLYAAWRIYRKVTPVADPKDDAGRALVPAGSRPYLKPEEL